MDGLNDARAMRIAEVINDYSAIQTQLANLRSVLTPDVETTPGGVILRQALTQGQVLLNRPLPTFTQPPSPGEGTRQSLQAIIVDAAARRFVVWRLHQRAAAGVRAIQRRRQLLQGQPATPAQQQALAQIDNTLRTEVLAVTDQKIFTELHAKDVAAGNWTAEMPALARVQQYVQQHLQ